MQVVHATKDNRDRPHRNRPLIALLPLAARHLHVDLLCLVITSRVQAVTHHRETLLGHPLGDGTLNEATDMTASNPLPQCGKRWKLIHCKPGERIP